MRFILLVVQEASRAMIRNRVLKRQSDRFAMESRGANCVRDCHVGAGARLALIRAAQWRWSGSNPEECAQLAPILARQMQVTD